MLAYALGVAVASVLSCVVGVLYGMWLARRR
jgi:uncharacterized protein YneF (UPF0154 family)